MSTKVITEITPLNEEDFFYLVDRYKTHFDFPIHMHSEIEINFVENCAGARRVVGDSVEVLGDYDLVIVGTNLEHVWEQHECKTGKIREVTIQFMRSVFGDLALTKRQLRSIGDLLDRAKSGVAFGQGAIVRNYQVIMEIINAPSDFHRVLKFLELLYQLSQEQDYKILSSTSFAKLENHSDSRRIRKIEEYVRQHFNEDIRLETVAELIYMSPTAFSRFFKLHTGRTFTDYTIEIRLGNASRLLAGTIKPVQEICYECGFNNISNFNRIFKRKRGYTPTEFREMYHKKRVIV